MVSVGVAGLDRTGQRCYITLLIFRVASAADYCCFGCGGYCRF